MGASTIAKQARRSAGVSAAPAVAKSRRHFRLRKKVAGSTERAPSGRHALRAAPVRAGRRRLQGRHTVASASTYKLTDGDKTAQAKTVGTQVAEAAKAAGVSRVVFDRGGNTYTGRVAAFADAPAKPDWNSDDMRQRNRRTFLMPGPQRTAAPAATTPAVAPAASAVTATTAADRSRRRPTTAWTPGREKSTHLERVVTINRVAKVVKGGRRFSFTALVIVGDGAGTRSASATARPRRCPAAIAKGVEEAKKNFFRVPAIAATIPHPVQGEKAAGVVLLKPASPGTGVIAGGPVRAVLECAGVHDVLSKSLGSDNPINIVHATVALR